MGNNKALKTVVCCAAATIFIALGNTKAQADTAFAFEQGVAGISYTLSNFYSAAVENNDIGDPDKAITNILSSNVSKLASTGVSIASNYVNVRSEPSTESKILGKLYRGSAATILEWLPGDWVKIESGDVKGYIASNYLATGRKAEKMIDDYAKVTATVLAQTLNVREEQSTESRILTQIPMGETYVVLNQYEEWVEILLGSGDEGDEGDDYTGYLYKDYIDINVEFKTAISIEEENRIIQAQREAERAEAERLRKLEEEERQRAAEKAERERLAREAAAKSQSQSNNSSQKTTTSSTSSKNVSALQKEIATYAQKFVGNPYKWGGESLTRGADCSGFVQTIYAQFGYKIDRVSRDQARTAGKKISISDRKPGDLIFYANGRGVVNHVAMYIGNDRVVHAANSKEGIKISKYNYRDIYCIRRVVN